MIYCEKLQTYCPCGRLAVHYRPFMSTNDVISRLSGPVAGNSHQTGAKALTVGQKPRATFDLWTGQFDGKEPEREQAKTKTNKNKNNNHRPSPDGQIIVYI